MGTCTLRIGDRVALSSTDGTPDVEYALFDPGEIELVKAGPGMVLEAGYQTTADDALARLKDAGVTWSLVVETAAAMQPLLAMTYARGPAVRRVATAFGPAELFDGFRYDPATKEYEGRWFDLPALAQGLGFPRLSHALQAMHLVALIREVTAGDPIRLQTRDLMARARPGQRSFKRSTIPAVAGLPGKLRAFAAEVRDIPSAQRLTRSTGPTSAEILEILRDRMVLAPDTESQDRLRAIERAIALRERPSRGPLNDGELWAIEESLSEGAIEGALERIDAVERGRGKQAVFGYLRLRAAFLAGREAPRTLAERVASLALSMPSFVELELLAIEAWYAAGEPKRALPFARDLISNASVTEELRIRESQMAMAPVAPPSAAQPAPATPRAAAPKEPTRPVPPPLPPAAKPKAPITPVQPMPATIDPQALRLTAPPAPVSPESARSHTEEWEVAPDANRGSTRPMPILGTSGPPTARPQRLSVPPTPARPQPAAARKDTPPMSFGIEGPEPRPQASPVLTSRSPLGPAKRPISGTWVGPPPPKAAEPGRVTASHFAAPTPAQPPTAPPPPPRPTSRPVTLAHGASAMRTPSHGMLASARTPTPPPAAASTRTTSRPSADVPRLANRSAEELMRGASQPPFRSDSPEAHIHIPRPAATPRFDDAAEGASGLALPDGLDGVPDPIETLPRTVIDARVQFTFLARELGREYEEKLGIVLRADISGVEAMQRVLLERYQSRSVATQEAAADVRRHGAFLSEILARSFGAFWVDIGPSDVGYWAMLVPPVTRVWPFGRILRLIAMQHNERDLVSYFLELQGRAQAR